MTDPSKESGILTCSPLVFAYQGCFKIPTLLLVEDNELNRDMISRRLSNRGFDVMTAKNAEDGIESVRNEPPDLVLMDLSLPDLDGWTATEELKKKPSSESIPIIAITAHATKHKRDKALEAGCEAYESKPVNFDRLVDKIESLLNYNE